MTGGTGQGHRPLDPASFLPHPPLVTILQHDRTSRTLRQALLRRHQVLPPRPGWCVWRGSCGVSLRVADTGGDPQGTRKRSPTRRRNTAGSSINN